MNFGDVLVQIVPILVVGAVMLLAMPLATWLLIDRDRDSDHPSSRTTGPRMDRRDDRDSRPS